MAGRRAGGTSSSSTRRRACRHASINTSRFDDARNAALKQLRGLGADDEVMLITAARTPEVLVGFTRDHAAVETGVAAERAHGHQRRSCGGAGIHGERSPAQRRTNCSGRLHRHPAQPAAGADARSRAGCSRSARATTTWRSRDCRSIRAASRTTAARAPTCASRTSRIARDTASSPCVSKTRS